MRLRTLFPIACIWLISPTAAVAGGEEPFEAIDAEAMINTCWDTTYTLRSGSTADMRQGISETVLCLQANLLDQLEALWSPKIFPPEAVMEELNSLRGIYGDLYWRLYNEHEGCAPCGTIYRTFDVSAEARLLEQLLRDAVAQRNKYRR